MRRFAFLIVIGMLATMATIPFAHASDPQEIQCVGDGGDHYSGGSGWTIRSGINAPVIGLPGCAVTSDLPSPDAFEIGTAVSLGGATGDFACGNGSLSETSGVLSKLWIGASPPYYLKWTATFSDGSGTLTGTATPFDNSGDRTLSGTITIEDGGATALCNDTFPNARVIIDLTIS